MLLWKFAAKKKVMMMVLMMNMNSQSTYKNFLFRFADSFLYDVCVSQFPYEQLPGSVITLCFIEHIIEAFYEYMNNIHSIAPLSASIFCISGASLNILKMTNKIPAI